jgi:transposase
MRIQTILNRAEKFKSFIYGEARFEEHDDGPAPVIQIKPRKNSRPFCSGCGRRGRPYDRLEERRFEFVPIWGIFKGVFKAFRSGTAAHNAVGLAGESPAVGIDCLST